MRSLTLAYIRCYLSLAMAERLICLFLRAGLLSSLIVSIAFFTGQAAPRWFLSVKSGSALGLLGLEIEREWPNVSVGLCIGGIDRPWGFSLIVRRYAQPSSSQTQTFMDLRVGTMGIGSPRVGHTFPFLGIGTEYALHTGSFRFVVEAGIGMINPAPTFTPLTQIGLFFGIRIWVNLCTIKRETNDLQTSEKFLRLLCNSVGKFSKN